MYRYRLLFKLLPPNFCLLDYRWGGGGGGGRGDVGGGDGAASYAYDKGCAQLTLTYTDFKLNTKKRCITMCKSEIYYVII